jgi:hypothetical protein
VKSEEVKRLAEELGRKGLDNEDLERRLKHVEKILDDKSMELKEIRGIVANLETSIQTKNLEIRHLRVTIDELNYRSGKGYQQEEPRPSPCKLYLWFSNDFSSNFQ